MRLAQFNQYKLLFGKRKDDGPFWYSLEFPIFGFSIRHHGINFVHLK